MVVKCFNNVRVEKQWRDVGTMWNGVQNMCVMEDNVDANRCLLFKRIINSQR
jgi:hypothetical protein